MAAENCVICLLGAMDRLWFHQIILFSEPEETLLPHSELSTKNSSNNNSETSLITDQESSVISETAVSQDELSSPESENETTPKERVLSAEKYWRNIRCIGSVRRLQKTMSCKNLGELELEEVKGFMDLGFVFEKEKVSKRMMNLIPGLQRLQEYKYEEKDVYDDHDHDDEDEDEDEESRGIMRPYLSESWLIRRPDSPLLNLRIPRASTAADMKKHLKYWARTVASSIQLES